MALVRRLGVWVVGVLVWAAVGLCGVSSASAASVFTQVPGSPFSLAANLGGPAVFSPSGALLVVGDRDGTVSVFSTNSAGALTAVGGSPFAGALNTDSLAFSPSGALLAVPGSITLGADSLVVFSVNSAGVLTQVAGSPFATGNEQPVSVAFSPAGGLLAAGNADGTVSLFSVTSGGALTQVAGSPSTAAEGSPFSLAFNPSGQLLAVAGQGPVSVFSVNSAGAPTQVTGSPFGAGAGPSHLAFSPSGGLLAVTNYAGTVSVFSINSSTGALVPVAGSPFATGAGSESAAFSPSGGLLAVANYNAYSVSLFSVSSAGGLTPLPGWPYATGAGAEPSSAAFSPSGGLLAVTNAISNSVSVFSVGPPVAAIASPSSRGIYPVNGSVPTSFSCADAPYAPGISSCLDSTGSGGGSGQLDTSSLGPHTYAVTATSNDGQTSTASISYTVTAAPSAQITSPRDGATYARWEHVVASFDCLEGAGGPGMASCAGTAPNDTPIDTATLGRHTFTVTGSSSDGERATSTVTYTVAEPSNRITVSHVKAQADGTITFQARVPGAGRLDMLQTAWDHNIAHTASVLQPAAQRFAAGRARADATHAGLLHLQVSFNAQGKRLIQRHRYVVTLRLWVTFTPTGGTQASVGFYGLHLGRGCPDVAGSGERTKTNCAP